MKEGFFLQCLVFVIFALNLCQEGAQKEVQSTAGPTFHPFGHWASAL